MIFYVLPFTFGSLNVSFQIELRDVKCIESEKSATNYHILDNSELKLGGLIRKY